MKRAMTAILALLALASASASASLWNWTINNTTGTFTTTGTGWAPGNYLLLDFSVTSSGDGASVGSLLGGEYAAAGFSTSPPYDFDWDGTKVTSWNQSGFNTFDWWVFDDLSTGYYVFFGWETGNINNPSQGAIYFGPTGCCEQPSYQIFVQPASSQVPEPGTIALLATALAGLGFGARRLKA